MRRAVIALAMLGVASACTCEPAHTPEVEVEVVDVPRDALPRARRGDLPAATPMVTLEVREDGFTVDNRALIATWPERDRARLSDAEIHAEVPVASEALEVPALSEVMARARRTEEARAEGGGTPIAYALRAAPEVSWRRVSQAMWSAGREGWAEPRVVLLDGEREVVLALPPSHRGRRADVEREVAAALEALGEGTPRREGATRHAEVEPASPSITITATLDVQVTLRGEPLAPSCDAVSPSAPAIPARERHVDVDALARCLDAARATATLAPDERALFAVAAAPSVQFGEITAVLETLASRGEIAIRATP
ncbi:hypothetical protein [Sandaracinus amylolyticus]|uniref:Uncharacterized protein n=1 Tax=Sandaracinus amylolyticus TaxID=927083 RepID=A0A0F6W8T9_9BACT|nr:hypothetical protein [Sandaracinus amylolyticus]AKF10406.1 hypothetical protein DB32_007555 [Sandaracinus amylolyticus]